MIQLLGTIITMIGAGLAIGIWCALVTLLFPEPVRVARNSALIAPFTALLVGCLALAAGFGLTALMTLSLRFIVTALCIPLIAIFDIFLIGMIAIGLAVVAEPVGHMILRRRGIYAAPIAASAVGGVTMTLIVALLNGLPLGLSIIGKIALVIIFSVGVGALALTRFGRRAYPHVHFV